jgi:hypothetical protein
LKEKNQLKQEKKLITIQKENRNLKIENNNLLIEINKITDSKSTHEMDTVTKVTNQNLIINNLDKTVYFADTEFFYKFFEELNGCTLDLYNLVSSCIAIQKGDLVDINRLLGCIDSKSKFYI